MIQATPPAKRKPMRPNASHAGATAWRLTRSDYGEYVLLIGMGQTDPLDTHRTFGGDVGGRTCLPNIGKNLLHERGRSSICTGEQVAGFKDSGGKFEELMLIRNDKDLAEFLNRYQVEESEIKREW